MSSHWRSRGYLPHFDPPRSIQFVTWRTGDSLPVAALQALEAELHTIPENERTQERMRRIDRLLDLGHGSCLLRNPTAARIVTSALQHFEPERYDTIAFCVMPNHVHLLIQLAEGWDLARIIHSLKSYTSHRINKELGRKGSVWQREYFDRIVRNEEHAEKTRLYIEWNPVKANLCVDPKDWPYSSAWEKR